MAIVHNEDCIKRQEAQKAWMTKWPNMCFECYAHGWFRYPATQWEPEDVQECGKCLGEGKCPRCGEEIKLVEMPEMDYNKCDHCGWTDEKEPMPDDMFCPEVDCYCYENDIYNINELKENSDG